MALKKRKQALVIDEDVPYEQTAEPVLGLPEPLQIVRSPGAHPRRSASKARRRLQDIIVLKANAKSLPVDFLDVFSAWCVERGQLDVLSRLMRTCKQARDKCGTRFWASPKLDAGFEWNRRLEGQMKPRLCLIKTLHIDHPVPNPVTMKDLTWRALANLPCLTSLPIIIPSSSHFISPLSFFPYTSPSNPSSKSTASPVFPRLVSLHGRNDPGPAFTYGFRRDPEENFGMEWKKVDLKGSFPVLKSFRYEGDAIHFQALHRQLGIPSKSSGPQDPSASPFPDIAFPDTIHTLSLTILGSRHPSDNHCETRDMRSGLCTLNTKGDAELWQEQQGFERGQEVPVGLIVALGGRRVVEVELGIDVVPKEEHFKIDLAPFESLNKLRKLSLRLNQRLAPLELRTPLGKYETFPLLVEGKETGPDLPGIKHDPLVSWAFRLSSACPTGLILTNLRLARNILSDGSLSGNLPEYKQPEHLFCEEGHQGLTGFLADMAARPLLLYTASEDSAKQVDRTLKEIEVISQEEGRTRGTLRYVPAQDRNSFCCETSFRDGGSAVVDPFKGYSEWRPQSGGGIERSDTTAVLYDIAI